MLPINILLKAREQWRNVHRTINSARTSHGLSRYAASALKPLELCGLLGYRITGAKADNV
jgi:hypothetical protein